MRFDLTKQIGDTLHARWLNLYGSSPAGTEILDWDDNAL